MEKVNVITFEAPNGVKVQAAVLHRYSQTFCGKYTGEMYSQCKVLAYTQNRIVLLNDRTVSIAGHKFGKITQDKIIVEYCVIPELDLILKQHYESTSNS